MQDDPLHPPSMFVSSLRAKLLRKRKLRKTLVSSKYHSPTFSYRLSVPTTLDVSAANLRARAISSPSAAAAATARVSSAGCRGRVGN